MSDMPRITMDEVRPEPRLSGRAYHIVTYGCQMNAHDSEQIAGILDRMGMHEAASRDEADLVIYNTCCVRDNAERRALGNVGWLKELKKGKARADDGRVWLHGAAAGHGRKAHKAIPVPGHRVGTHELYKLPDMMRERLDSRARVVCVSEDDMVAEGLPVKRVSRIQAYVNIMYGCNNFCSYCIVPYVRGRERSRLPEDILREVEELKCDGVREVMLLGQNVNSYSGGGLDFAGLLREVDAIGVERIRFMTSHPKDLSDALIDVMSNSHHICHQLHLPVQHGSDRVLEAMNRRYTAAHYLGLVDNCAAQCRT